MNLDNLRELILSLSATEKRYFRLYLSNNKAERVTVSLFDLLTIEPLAENVKKKLRQKHPKADIEIARKHLYKMLMKVLRNYESNKHIEHELGNIIQNINILLAKGLYHIGKEEIERGKKLSTTYDKPLYYLLISKLELDLESRFNLSRLKEGELISIHHLMGEKLKSELLFHQHASLYRILLSRLQEQGPIKNLDAVSGLNDLLLEEFQINATGSSESFEKEKIHLLFQSVYFMMTGNEYAALRVFEELNELFEKNRSIWKGNPVHYIHMVEGILTELTRINKYDEMDFYLKKLEGMEEVNETITLQIKVTLIKFQLLKYFQSSETEGIHKILTGFEAIEKKKNLLSLTSYLDCCIVVAQALYILNQLKRSLQYINVIINTPNVISKPIYDLARSFNLIVHYNLRNEDYLQYEIKSFKRYLKTRKDVYKTELLLADFIKELLDGKNQKRFYQTFYEKIQLLSAEDHLENLFIQKLRINSWLKPVLGIL